MPSPGRVQLNLSVEPEIKEILRNYCDKSNLSFAQAITEYAIACKEAGKLIFTGEENSTITSTGIDLDSYVTKEQLDEAIASVNSSSTNAIPGKALEEKLMRAIAKKLETTESSLNQKLESAIASLREELQPILESEREMQKLAGDDEFIRAIATEVKK